MKNLSISMFALLLSAVNSGILVADDSVIQLDPMIQIELNADMKADVVLAENLMTLDIVDDLAKRQKAFQRKTDRSFLKPRNTEQLVAVNESTYSDDRFTVKGTE